MTDDEKALYLTLAMCCIETVWEAENAEKRLSARCTRLSRGIDQIVSLLDIYRKEEWKGERMDIACHIHTELASMITEALNGRDKGSIYRPGGWADTRGNDYY